MLSAISKLGAIAPSCVKLSNCCSFPQSVLQAQKMVKIEQTVGPERWEEEPKGEIIVRPSGEALEPPDSGTSLSIFQGIYLIKKLLHIRSSSQIHFIHLELSQSQMSHLKMMNLRSAPRSSMKLTGHAPGQRQGV